MARKDSFYQILFFLSFSISPNKVIDGLGYFCFATSCADFVTEAGDKLIQVIQLVGVGQVVDTIRPVPSVFVLGNFSYVFCHRFVC